MLRRQGALSNGIPQPIYKAAFKYLHDFKFPLLVCILPASSPNFEEKFNSMTLWQAFENF